jgi:cytochrome c oxidase subunit 3
MAASHSAAAEAQEGPIGPPHVHHMDPVTAYHAAKLGMWLFLATEILLFSVLFCSYALFHWYYFDEFHAGSLHLDWRIGSINTIVLLASSFTAALAVDAAQHGDNKRVNKHLAITIALGGVFLVVKAFEYHEKWSHGLFPGGENFFKYLNFLPLYFCLTGLHALHVIIGMTLLGWAMSKSLKNRYSPDYYTPVEVGALYWHLVDLIWIYLFPLLYLVG